MKSVRAQLWAISLQLFIVTYFLYLILEQLS